MDIKVLFFVLAISYVAVSAAVSRQILNNSKKESKLRIKTIWRPRSEVYENVFNLYDPTFLAVIWPGISNGVHLVVGNKCWRDVTLLFKELSRGEAWAYKVIDATGRYPSALFAGNKYWLGSKEQCLQLDSRANNDTNKEITLDDFIDSNYNKVVARKEKFFDDAEESKKFEDIKDEIAPPYHVAYYAVNFKLNINKRPLAKIYDVTLGVCMPESCSFTDVQSLLNFSNMLIDKLKSNYTLTRTIKITSLRRIEAVYDLTSDISAISLITITLLLFVIAVVGTLVDLNIHKWRPYPRSMSFDVQKFNKEPIKRLERTSTKEVDSKTGIPETETLAVTKPRNVDLLTVKKMKPNLPPSITIDVPKERDSCKRCGKYKQQCSKLKKLQHLGACSTVKSFCSVSTEVKKERPYWQKILVCFSLKYSMKRVFNKNMANKNLMMVHWLRILATFWIILVHVSVIVNYLSDNPRDFNERNNAYYILATGNLAFDTLFFTSGLFSSHHFFYLKNQYTVKELVSFGGFCGQILQFVCFVTNRAVRLLPPYIYVIFLSGVLSRMSRQTSVLTLPENDHYNCPEYWWRNMLYINTFFPKEDRCMQVSWYLSTETQLHAAAMLLVTGCAGARVPTAVFLSAAGLLAATAADVIYTYNDFNKIFPSLFSMYSTIIDRPWAHIAPYFLGVFAGWLIHKLDKKMNGSKIVACCLWLVSIITIIISATLLWLAPVWISAWLHLTWPIALLWPALVCSTKYAESCRKMESRWVSALSRLCAGALVTHGPAARALLLAGAARCASAACVWWYFTGVAVLTLVVALPLSLLIEMPCCSLLRRMTECRKS